MIARKLFDMDAFFELLQRLESEFLLWKIEKVWEVTKFVSEIKRNLERPNIFKIIIIIPSLLEMAYMHHVVKVKIYIASESL